MSILTDLSAALAAKEQADAQLRQPITSDHDYRAKRQRWIQAEQQLHKLLTTDTIRALLDVAREGVCPICHMRMAEGVYRNEDDEYVTCPAAYHAALAPLFPDEESGVAQDAQRVIKQLTEVEKAEAKVRTCRCNA